MRNTSRVHTIIRLLKVDFGRPLVFVKHLSTTSNPATGRKSVSSQAYPVSEAIVLPRRASLAEKRGISLISSNKQVVQGGQYDSEMTQFVIDADDIPMPTVDDWLIVDGEKFQIDSTEMAEENAGWIIKAKSVGQAENIRFARFEQFVSASDEVSS